jgi:glutaredoxin 3
MVEVRMYCTAFCPYCVRAEMLLKSKGVEEIDKISLDYMPHGFSDLFELTGRRTVPQIFIGGQHIGGFDDLAALDASGGLEPLLADD